MANPYATVKYKKHDITTMKEKELYDIALINFKQITAAFKYSLENGTFGDTLDEITTISKREFTIKLFSTLIKESKQGYWWDNQICVEPQDESEVRGLIKFTHDIVSEFKPLRPEKTGEF